jgi:predicted PurR-regulated permease PerM
VFAALVVGVVVFVAALGALLVDQVGDLVDAIPGYARQISDSSTRRPRPARRAR